MEIKRNGANGRRAQSVSYNGILYTSGITTTDLDADITALRNDQDCYIGWTHSAPQWH